MVNMGELFAYERIDENVSMDLVPMSECEAKSFSVLKGDLLFARQSLVLSGAGKCSYIKNLKQTTTFESHIIRARIDQSKASPLFYYYFFRSPQGKQTILSIVEQVAAAGIRGSDLKRLQVPVPPLPEQQAIAAILSALDDKIELNRQMNKTLEEMAQAIFKEWFVDFGPFRDGGMQDSELGPIPVGWRARKLQEFFPVVTGKKDANFASTSGPYPFFSCSQKQTLFADSYSFKGPAVLLAGNGDFNVKWCTGNFEAYQRTYVLIPYNSKLFGTLYFMMQHFLSDLTIGHQGSVIQFITKGMITEYEVVLPEDNELEIMSNIFYAILEHIEMLSEENKTITSIRDTLLPKLMSGELRVPVSDNAG